MSRFIAACGVSIQISAVAIAILANEAVAGSLDLCLTLVHCLPVVELKMGTSRLARHRLHIQLPREGRLDLQPDAPVC